VTGLPSENGALVEQLIAWMEAPEGEHFEFKEAKNTFSLDELARYVCALANEGGGRILLGVSNDRPRRVVGSKAFLQIERTRQALLEKFPLRIGMFEIAHPDGRVVVVDVSPRPSGVPIKLDGRYLARRGDALVALDENRLRAIFEETGKDFSATICETARFSDLLPAAVEEFRRRWAARSPSVASAQSAPEQLLRDAELMLGDQLTFAALILFGSRSALTRHLAQAEVVFEYRSAVESGPAQQRKDYREGFFAYAQDLWDTINQRNDLQHYQDGLFVVDIPTFAERSVREAILNAVSHRDYMLGGNVFVRQFPRHMTVESPGGLPLGITPENILDRQSPRNRRIAETLARCGLVERSGQGMNLMFEQSIRQGKARPSIDGSDAYFVKLTLHGEVQDPRFVQFLERVGRETQASFDTPDFLILDLVHREMAVPADLAPRLRRLADLGVIETMGRGRGVRYLLSRRFYVSTGQSGVYTRRRGLDREQNQELLVAHLRRGGARGCPVSELEQVLPGQSRAQIKSLLRTLRSTGRVRLEGVRRWARWILVSSAAGSSVASDGS
jgi:ATP-dependent DNA helicase RecG